jgi:hypothetical protein
MKVDKTSMLVTGMTDEEAEECYRVADKIVMNGIIEWDNSIIRMWMATCSDNENQRFLLGSTAMPQRLLMSYIWHIWHLRDKKVGESK